MKFILLKYIRLYLLSIILACPLISFSQLTTTKDSPIHITSENKIEYKLAPNGDRVPDFSYCGYMASESQIPNVPVKLIIPEVKEDATSLIQSAINYVSSLPMDGKGFRGAILLEKGTFKISGSLSISASGVVLRGSGSGTNGTALLAAGNDRETLIRVVGKKDRSSDNPVLLEDVYFPVNTTKLTFPKPHSFKIGDKVIINRPSTKEWIESIGADKIGIYVNYELTKWEPGDFDMNWDRNVVAVSPNSITIDAPITNSIDPKYGGGTVSRYNWDGRIKNVGIENIRCVSTYDTSNAKDENHRWMAITMDDVYDSWVRRIVAENFVSSAVAVWETAKRITVEDCKSLNPVGEIGNYRRYSFQTLGQQVLFQRCYAEYGYHAFSVGFTTPGPNAFVQCYSYMPYNFSGAIGGWANGILFDKMTVDGGNISFAFRDVDGQGGGWSAANSLCWQGRSAQIHLSAPPETQNWAYGSWAQGYGNGHHELEHSFLKPESIYYAQLEARTGEKSNEEEKILIYDSSNTTAPSIELAAIYSDRSKTLDLTMDGWIDQMIEKYPINSDLSHSKMWDRIIDNSVSTEKILPITLKNGWIIQGDKIISGGRNRTSLWRGSTRSSELKKPTPNLVRFVPGRIGRGLTDDLDTLVSDMLHKNISAMQSFPALWYERRRDDHARTRRADADVWTPFYEQPFSRSGQGEAFDRLSKYDLTKWNSWYWLRLKQFADLADKNGLLYIEEHYLQHNIIEEGAHWVDYPWRTANNINNTGFSEPPPYAGDKRVYMADEFYDTTNPIRNHFHKEYIWKSLENFKDNNNIVHHLGAEYTGPLSFVKFWLDVISEWEKENHKDVLVMLPGTKDVQDAILSDPKKASLVDIIDIIQWKYRDDGTLYAPPGGVGLAGRQYARILNPGETSFDQIYHAVNEYRIKYPQKAVVYSQRGVKYSNWATFMAGGSLSSMPSILNDQFFKDAILMKSYSVEYSGNKEYVLGRPGIGYIFFNLNGDLKIDLKNDSNSYTLDWINPLTGELIGTKKIINNHAVTLKTPFVGAAVAWLHKK